MSNLYPTKFRYKYDVNWASTLPRLLLTAALLPLGIGYVGYSYRKTPYWNTPKFKEKYDNFADKIKKEPSVILALKEIEDALNSYKEVSKSDKEQEGYKKQYKASAYELKAMLKNLFKVVKPLVKKYHKEAFELEKEIKQQEKQDRKEEKKQNKLAMAIKVGV